MERILISDTSGIIGYQLSNFFRKDATISVDVVDTFLLHAFKNAPRGSAHYQSWLDRQMPGSMHYELDLRNRDGVMKLIEKLRPSVIVHAIPPPTLDEVARDPLTDCDLIVGGTLNLLEATRRFCWQSPFIFLGTDRVYGDRTNTVRLEEKENRWDFAEQFYENGIAEEFPIDHSTHSIPGAAAAAADLLVQEYGRSFHLPTCCLRSPIPVDPWQPDMACYDVLAGLVQSSVTGQACLVAGHGAKQVREAFHGHDVARFVDFYRKKPRPGEVYNLGGGRENSYSVVEASRLIQERTGRTVQVTYRDFVPLGEHICYFSDPRKIQQDYPDWRVTHSLAQIIDELIEAYSLQPG